jgi:hypothetical protein
MGSIPLATEGSPSSHIFPYLPIFEMLAFLSREPSNAKRVLQLQQEDKNSQAIKKAKKSVAEEKLNKKQPTLAFPPVSTFTQSSAPNLGNKLDVEGIIGSFVNSSSIHESFVSMSCASERSDETISIPAGVKFTMEKILLHVERKFGLKTRKSLDG